MMPKLTAKDVLNFWEHALIEQPLQRALDLLAVAYAESSPEQLKDMPVGQRDVRLLAIREALFGARLNCLASCPTCNERLELAFDIAQLRGAPVDSLALRTYSITIGDCEVEFRLP